MASLVLTEDPLRVGRQTERLKKARRVSHLNGPRGVGYLYVLGADVRVLWRTDTGPTILDSDILEIQWHVRSGGGWQGARNSSAGSIFLELVVRLITFAGYSTS